MCAWQVSVLVWIKLFQRWKLNLPNYTDDLAWFLGLSRQLVRYLFHLVLGPLLKETKAEMVLADLIKKWSRKHNRMIKTVDELELWKIYVLRFELNWIAICDKSNLSEP